MITQHGDTGTADCAHAAGGLLQPQHSSLGLPQCLAAHKQASWFFSLCHFHPILPVNMQNHNFIDNKLGVWFFNWFTQRWNHSNPSSSIFIVSLLCLSDYWFVPPGLLKVLCPCTVPICFSASLRKRQIAHMSSKSFMPLPKYQGLQGQIFPAFPNLNPKHHEMLWLTLYKKQYDQQGHWDRDILFLNWDQESCLRYLKELRIEILDSSWNGFDIIQSQPLCSSFKLIITFTFSSLVFKSWDSELLDKFSEVLVQF